MYVCVCSLYMMILTSFYHNRFPGSNPVALSEGNVRPVLRLRMTLSDLERSQLNSISGVSLDHSDFFLGITKYNLRAL